MGWGVAVAEVTVVSVTEKATHPMVFLTISVLIKIIAIVMAVVYPMYECVMVIAGQ